MTKLFRLADRGRWMQRLTRRLWRDRRGEASAMSMVLLTTILALGAIVGLATLRDSLVQEFGDVGVALQNINQSFTTATATYTDPFSPDMFPIDPPPGANCVNGEPGCIDVCSIAATPES